MLRRLAMALLIGLGQLLAVSPTLANTTVESALRLGPANPAVADTLTGDSGGAFRYYAVQYPGGGLPVAVVMRAQPGRGTAGVATGFKIYGPTGYFGDAIGDDRSATDSTYNLTLVHGVPGTYYIQVYNFVHGLPLSFQLRVSGLPAAAAPAAAPAAQPSPAPSASPDQPTRPQVRDLTTGGLLPPNAAGSFAFYELDYPGGRTKMTLTIGYSPLAANSEAAVGFNVYRSDPSAPGGATLVGTSAETGRNESSATEGFTLEADDAERYLLQVFSYLPTTQVSYTLVVTGLTGPVAQVDDPSDPARAHVLDASQVAGASTLPGDRSGRFHYFLLQYPGGDREVRITVTMDASGVTESEVGLNVWKDAERVGVANAMLAPKGKRVATLTIKQADAQTFGIQLFNYSAGQSVPYIITVTGL